MNKIVKCKVLGVFSRDNPEQTIVFETEDGFRFTRKTREIPWQVQNTVVDTFDNVKAEVEAEPDDLGNVGFIKFIL
jgi:DNA integrity scanning protein DisA with diadenylate cyclase activity